MRRYETIFIADPDLNDEARVTLFDRMESIITERNGLHIETDVWGTKRLAYAIKKKERGHYVRFDYCGSSEIVNELERASRIDDRILKYLTVLLDESPDLEQIQEEMAQKQIDQESDQKAAESVEKPTVSVAEKKIDTEPEPKPESESEPKPDPEATATAKDNDADPSKTEIIETKES